MDGTSMFTHVCVDSRQTVLEHHRPIQRDPFTHISVDSSQTVLKHHRPFIPIYISISWLKEKKNQGSCRELSPGPPALDAGALTTCTSHNSYIDVVLF